MTSDGYMYCFIRKDLPVAQQIIQMAHATQQAGNFYDDSGRKTVPNFVLFEVESREELEEAYNYVWNQGFRCFEFSDSIFDHEMTSFCTEPVFAYFQRQLFADFKLYRNDIN